MASNSIIFAHDSKDDHTDLKASTPQYHDQQPADVVLRQEGVTQNDEQDGGIPIISNKTMMLEARIRRLKIRSHRSLRRYDDSSQAEPKVEDISLRTVMEAISLLRDSTEEKQAIVPVRRRSRRTTQNLALQVLHEDYELNTTKPSFDPSRIKSDEQESLASIALIEESYQEAEREMDELGEALNKQQLKLFERQAYILSLRMKIVNTMMEFEYTSKLIKEDASRIEAETRLSSTWPKLGLDNAEERDRKVHTSWREMVSSSSDSSSSVAKDDLDFESESPFNTGADRHLIGPELVPRNELPRLTHHQTNTEPSGGKISLTSDHRDMSQSLKELGKLPFTRHDA
jgi:hypothetical protein